MREARAMQTALFGDLSPARIAFWLAAAASCAPATALAAGAPLLAEIVMRLPSLPADSVIVEQALRLQAGDRGIADQTVARLWGLPVDTPIEQLLLRSANAQRGSIRHVALPAASDAMPMGVIALRYLTDDVVGLYERLLPAQAQISAPLQILRLAPYGATRAFAIRGADGSAAQLEFFEPGAKPMSERELRTFTRLGRYSTWTRFNNQLTGTVLWRADGSARVKWDAGGLDEEGTWTIRGDAVCTAWKRLRNNRELCVQHFRLAGDTTQSFRRDGTPDGIHVWKKAGELQ